MFFAVAGEKTLPEELPLFVIDEAERTVGLGSLMREQLKATLDLNVKVFPMPIGDLVQRLFRQEAPWAAGPDTGPEDLDDWLHPYFHSEGTKNTMAVRDPELDSLINAQRLEFDTKARRELGFQAQRRILTNNAAVNFVSERVVTLSWPYVKNLPLDATDGYQHRFADAWLDRNEASFRGRA